MTTQKIAAGANFLAMRSGAVMAKVALPAIRNVLLVEDDDSDARRFAATLRIVLGRGVNAARAESVGDVAAAIETSPPDIVFIDDYLKPDDSALETIPELRRAGYTGPIIVMSGEMGRARSIVLMAAGASVTMHKEDINSVTIADAMHRAFDDQSTFVG